MTSTSPRLDAALSIADTLAERAVWSNDQCLWLGDAMMPLDGDWKVAHRAFEGDLYSGSAGTAWFLAQAAAISGDDRHRRGAIGGLDHAMAWAAGLDLDIGFTSSLYSGALGPAVIAVRAAELIEEATLFDRGLELGAKALASAPSNVENDVIGGHAGALMAALVLHEASDRSEFLDHAVQLGAALMERARSTPHGLAWGSVHGDASGEAPLCGLGHGAAGIALALDELAVVSGDAQFAETATAAVGYERAWFDQGMQNWPDLREITAANANEQSPAFPAFWCHGAVGIGLARLRRHALTGDQASLSEAVAAVDTTSSQVQAQLGDFAYDYAHNFSLCHGFAGSLELLLAASVAGNDEAAVLASEVGEYGIEHCGAADADWPCGVRDGGETPGLMLGLAGIGAMYLRLHDSTNVAPTWWFAPGLGGATAATVDDVNVTDRPPRIVVQVASGEPEPQAVVDELLLTEPTSRLVRMSKRGRAVIELDGSTLPASVVTHWSEDPRLDYVERDGADRQADEATE